MYQMAVGEWGTSDTRENGKTLWTFPIVDRRVSANS